MRSPEDIAWKDFYDQLALQTLSHGLEAAWKNMEADDLVRAMAVAKTIGYLHPTSILEIAAGYGFVTKQIVQANPGVSITCLEIATPFCDVLRKEGYEVIEDNFVTCDLKGRQWDVVTIMQVLEHLTDWTTLKKTLAKVSSLAKRYVVVEIPEGGPIDGERHILSLTAERIELTMSEIGLTSFITVRIPPQGKQIENGYTSMAQIVGMKQ